MPVALRKSKLAAQEKFRNESPPPRTIAKSAVVFTLAWTITSGGKSFRS